MKDTEVNALRGSQRDTRLMVCVCVCVHVRAGMRNRQTGSHGLNEFSSRSHSVLTVTIDSETQPDADDDNLYVTKRGKLSFVDLAGEWVCVGVRLSVCVYISVCVCVLVVCVSMCVCVCE